MLEHLVDGRGAGLGHQQRFENGQLGGQADTLLLKTIFHGPRWAIVDRRHGAVQGGATLLKYNLPTPHAKCENDATQSKPTAI